MTAPLLSNVERPVLLRWYLVPCLLVRPSAWVHWMPDNGWVPILGPKHRDADHLEFDDEHYHIDWRFMPERKVGLVMRTRVAVGGTVITYDGHGLSREIRSAPELRRLQCRREMPTFPGPTMLSTRPVSEHHTSAPSVRWARLERAQAITCNKLKPGNVCPHRGIALDQFAQPDGSAVCPGHGLRWNLATGELMPRFTA